MIIKMEHRTLVINIFITTKYTNILRTYKIKNKIKQFKNNEMFFKLAKIYKILSNLNLQ